MDIKALLNPAAESQMIDEVTDKEIFHMVLDAQNAEEEGPINGGDEDIDDNASVEACLTCCEVLQPSAVITRYIDIVDDPLTCKLETVLASFGHQMHLAESHSMITTHLTDFFSHK
jgi:hypothetical protein